MMLTDKGWEIHTLSSVAIWNGNYSVAEKSHYKLLQRLLGFCIIYRSYILDMMSRGWGICWEKGRRPSLLAQNGHCQLPGQAKVRKDPPEKDWRVQRKLLSFWPMAWDKLEVQIFLFLSCSPAPPSILWERVRRYIIRPHNSNLLIQWLQS